MKPDELIDHLNGLRAMTALAILALHAVNVQVVIDGKPAVSGFELLAFVGDAKYWERQQRTYPKWLFDFASLALKSPEQLPRILSWSENSLSCNMAASAYELVKSCARENDLLDQLYAQPWWGFLRCVRNVTNHDLIVEVPRGLTFPIAWSDLTFVDSMVGKPLQIDNFFDDAHSFALVGDVESWLRSLKV